MGIVYPVDSMNRYISTTQYHQRSLLLNLREFWGIYCCLTRQAELRRLVQWAEKKRLKYPRKCYLSRLADEERRIFSYRVNAPQLTRVASGLQCLNSILNPTPRYHPRGSAAAYRRYKHLTYSKMIL